MAFGDVWLRSPPRRGGRTACRDDAYPGYQPFCAPPAILHYGSDYTTVGNAYFNKMMHTELHLDRRQLLFPDPVAGNSTPAFFGALS